MIESGCDSLSLALPSLEIQTSPSTSAASMLMPRKSKMEMNDKLTALAAAERKNFSFSGEKSLIAFSVAGELMSKLPEALCIRNSQSILALRCSQMGSDFPSQYCKAPKTSKFLERVSKPDKAGAVGSARTAASSSAMCMLIAATSVRKKLCRASFSLFHLEVNVERVRCAYAEHDYCTEPKDPQKEVEMGRAARIGSSRLVLGFWSRKTNTQQYPNVPINDVSTLNDDCEGVFDAQGRSLLACKW